MSLRSGSRFVVAAALFAPGAPVQMVPQTVEKGAQRSVEVHPYGAGPADRSHFRQRKWPTPKVEK